MKSRKRVPKRSSDAEQKPVRASEVPADKKLSSLESIGAMENEMVDDADREENEAAERDYEGRSTNQEDGAIPADAADRISTPRDATRAPNRPPRHNM